MKDKYPSIAEALNWAREKLHLGESPQVDAKVLLQHVLGCEPVYLLTWPERCLTELQWQQYQDLLEKREAGQPVAYLIGLRDFWSLSLKVSPATLIPRPDTEVLVEQSLKKIVNLADTEIVDLGTGTGAIALAIASECPLAKVYASDLREDAVQLARENASSLHLSEVDIRQGSWLEPFSGQTFDLIVSNPPYIDPQDPHLSQGDVRFEPISALTSEQNGLADIKHIIDTATDYLKAGGWLLLEHGYDQKQAVQQLLDKAGYSQIFTEQDYGGMDRVSGGCYLA
ncbi:peptide chain release factor N(5)-glutamine methyltransferase [Agarivorans sp. TSD2052]|uniref:peptide chain release factor N(5)-glutamine methyltransferase n=1 Tax=Agarivorans sp. TSD2052 TaxID=2937286 RepID=UPI00200FFD63|nr:peptide chain release factor N(5)-glutamine methyltransferase [Agarivorans sp. TSD2052]UPW19914.1 peptide chain release factor N(5)-glutamine methyltransferase [Agarivorans sp. TSD2052]